MSNVKTVQKLSIVWAVLAVLVSVSLPGGTTTLVSLSLDDLVGEADLIVEGRVLDTHSLETARGRVVTDATLQVERYLLRSGPAELKVRSLGGEVADRAVYTAGAARLETGKEYVLFLFNKTWPDGSDSYLVVGMLQGRFPLTVDPQTGERFIQRSLDGINVIPAPGIQPRSASQPEGSIYMTLSQFEAEIQKRIDTRR